MPMKDQAAHMRKRRADPEDNARIKESARRTRFQRLYGLSPSCLDAAHAAQGGVCALCGVAKPAPHHPGPSSTKLVVDHCHDTGVYRGLLCHVCNTALGKLGDSPAAIRRVLNYLEAPCSPAM